MESKILVGNCLETLKTLPKRCVQTCVTSPPYWGLRDYGVPKQLGLEKTPQEYVSNLVEVFRLVRELLADDGTLWLNLGDSYHGSWGNSGNRPELDGKGGMQRPKNCEYFERGGWDERRERPASSYKIPGLKPKDLIGIPWRVAFALQADGWYLRQDIIWSKPNPMPESVRDRCTRSHEYIFMLTKNAKYYYNADAIKNPPSDALIQQINEGYSGVDSKDFAVGGAQSASSTKTRIIENARKKIDKQRGHGRRHAGFNDRWAAMTRKEQMSLGSNKRSVWVISPKPFKGAHFATFPPDLVEPCILAGSKPGDTVLDPFSGSGTTGLVAQRYGRNYILCELNPAYAAMAKKRIMDSLSQSFKGLQ